MFNGTAEKPKSKKSTDQLKSYVHGNEATNDQIPLCYITIYSKPSPGGLRVIAPTSYQGCSKPSCSNRSNTTFFKRTFAYFQQPILILLTSKTIMVSTDQNSSSTGRAVGHLNM